jgi:hypothetical protein
MIEEVEKDSLEPSLTCSEAARETGISERQLIRAVKSGKLQALNIGKVVLRSDLEAFKRDYLPSRRGGNVRRGGRLER